MRLIKKIAIFALCALMLFVAVACNGEEGETTTPAATTPAATTPAVTTPDVTTDSGLVEYKATVVDEDGTPVSGVMVQICFEGTCVPARTNENGVAVFKRLPGEYSVKFMNGVPEGYTCDAQEFHYGDATELTITLKKA